MATVEVDDSSGFTEVGPIVAAPLPPDAPATAQAGRKRNIALPAVSLDAWGYRMFRRTLNSSVADHYE